MSYNGTGTFNINTAGQPVVTGTTITSTAFNLLTADLASGLTTALTKDGQTTPTANIPLGGFKVTGLGAGTVATDAAQYGQLQANATTIATVTGTDTLVGSLTPALTAYATGNLFTFVAAGTNTGAATININSLGAKNITKQGSSALVAGDITSGQVYLIEYDGTRFQLINPSSASPTGVLPVVNGGTGLSALGSANQVLGVNSGGTALTFTTPSSGAMTLITTTTASSSSSIDFTGLSSTYKNYVVMITNCVLSVGYEYLAIRTSTNNGSSFDSSASSYAYRTIYSQQGTVSSVGSEGATYINPCASFFTSNTANNGGINGTITISNPNNASVTNMYGTLSSWEGSTLGVITFSGARLATAGVVNAIRFYPLSGNITSGTFKLYGIS